MNDCAKQPASTPKYIFMYGGLSPDTCENMNTLLDDNKKISYANGECVNLPPNTQIVFVLSEETCNG